MDTNSNLSMDSDQKMLKQVKGLMLCRIIILTLLLSITILFQISEKKYIFIPLSNRFYYFLSVLYLVTIVYALLLKKIKQLRPFIFIQIVADHLFITSLIYFTGGKESFFPIAYIFSIIGTSLIFYKRGAFISASFSTLLYGALLLAQYHHWINPAGEPRGYDASQVFFSLVIYMVTFYIVAFLSGIVSEELRKKKKELIQKQVDYNQLETFNRNIIQSLDSGLLTIDLEGKINFLNRTAEKILHLGRGRLISRSIYDLFPRFNEVIDQVKRKIPGSLDGQRYETVLETDDRKKIFLGFSSSPLTGPDDSLIGHTLIFQDITRFKEMEEQVKRVDKMAAVGLLAAGMAHEIRNPLAALSGSIQVLNAELNLDESQHHLMDIILRESERLNALITDFLLFAQPPQTNRIPSDVKTVMEETIQLFARSPSCHEGISLVPLNGAASIRAMIDPDQMRQVFWNLLINAAQAISRQGEIRVRLESETRPTGIRSTSAAFQARARTWGKISIADSGIGIPSHEKEKIFEPFYTTKENGTGLGLSIVHKIIENHEGIIKVDSETGRGSTFTIYLPMDEPAKEQAT